MKRLEFQVLGLTEWDLGGIAEPEEERSDSPRQHSSARKVAKGSLGGAKGAALLAVLATAGVAYTANSPTILPLPLQQSPARCVGQPITTFDLTGKLYVLPNGTIVIPDFSKLKPAGTIHVQRLQMSDRAAFPAAVNQAYAFGIDYRGRFWINSSDKYLFHLTSDDGSQLYVDGQLVIDNDGGHAATTKQQSIYLKRGWHTMRVPYFEAVDGAALFLDACRAETSS